MLLICKVEAKNITLGKMYACEEQKDGYVVINDNGAMVKYPKNYFRDVNVWDIIKRG